MKTEAWKWAEYLNGLLATDQPAIHALVTMRTQTAKLINHPTMPVATIDDECGVFGILAILNGFLEDGEVVAHFDNVSGVLVDFSARERS